MEKRLVIVFHEIYGVNQFILDVVKRLHTAGMEAVSYDLYHCPPFPYDRTEEAYQFYMKNVGFHSTDAILEYIAEQKQNYEKVYLLGFSVGATMAWILSEQIQCDGVVCCYGSRIRDYPEVEPQEKTLVLAAEEKSFDIGTVVNVLQQTKNVEVKRFKSAHGFMDPYNSHYNEEDSRECVKDIRRFFDI